jgi:hypothetical protein
MIDKVPEQVRLECKVSEETARRLLRISHHRRVDPDTLLAEAVHRYLDQIEQALRAGTDLNDEWNTTSEDKSSTMQERPVDGTDLHPFLPSPPILDESISAPCTLPLNDPKFVDTIPGPDLLPQPLRDEA